MKPIEELQRTERGRISKGIDGRTGCLSYVGFVQSCMTESQPRVCRDRVPQLCGLDPVVGSDTAYSKCVGTGCLSYAGLIRSSGQIQPILSAWGQGVSVMLA